ncbi:MAG TPA: peptidase [Cyclobacteriaceae bacterium]
MKTFLRITPFILLLFLLNECNEKTESPVASIPPPVGLPGYELDLTYITIDSFRVKLYVEGLTELNSIYQFAAAVPGTYRVMDFGQYVGGFKAYTKEGIRIPVNHSSINQWNITDPEQTRLISYSIKKTDEYGSADGSNLFKDCAFFNMPSIFGYVQGQENEEVKLKIITPSNWIVATTLSKNDDDYYTAPDFKSFSDQPVFAGLIEKNTTTAGGTQFDIYSFSQTGSLQTNELTADVTQAMNDAAAFLKVMPLDKYTFYYYYSPSGGGGLEHSQSSVHVNSESPYSSAYTRTRTAHEFFHVITPFNIHSDIIENFNFSTPTASQHLWLYEGVTVWAANLMQYRNGSMSINDLLYDLSGRAWSSVNPTSLTEMSLAVYKDQSSFLAYYKGAIAAALLDIKLLSLSNGTSGLRELILKLKENHGLHKPFAEEELFNEIVQLTYPEIEDFINQYIKGTSPLPLKELFNKIGIDMKENSFELVIMPTPTANQQFLFKQWSKNLN